MTELEDKVLRDIFSDWTVVRRCCDEPTRIVEIVEGEIEKRTVPA